jgi:hypothetical protein
MRFRKSRLSRIALSTAIALTFSFEAKATAINLVTNGSFENGLTGWTHTGSFVPVPNTQTSPASTIYYNTAAAYPISAFGEAVPTPNDLTASGDAPGAMGAYFSDDGAVDEGLSQLVFLAPGAYRIGFDVYAPSNGYSNQYDARFSAQIAGMTLANYMVSAEPATTWLNFSGVANIATGGLYAVSFLFNTPGIGVAKDVVVDRVFIEADNVVPAPGTLPLMALAGAAMTIISLRGRRSL